MGIGDWGLGIGDWGLGPIPNPQFFSFHLFSNNSKYIKLIYNHFIIIKQLLKSFSINWIIFKSTISVKIIKIMNCLDDWKTLNVRNKDLFYERWGASAIDNNGNIILFGGYSNSI